MRSLFLTIGLVVATSLSPTTIRAAVDGSDGQRPELVLFNWAEYIDPDIITEFEVEHGAKVRILFFEDDHDRDRTLSRSGGSGPDLILVDGTTISAYVDQGWLATIDEATTSNLRFVRKEFRNGHPYAFEYAVPYFWGTYGIAYRSDLVETPITSWKQLLEPTGALRGRVAMINDSRDLLTPALKSLGHSVNTSDRTALEEAARVLRAQRPFVKTYHALSLAEDSALVSGAVWAATMYSGDALALSEINDAIEYVIPEDGTSLWIDYWAISSKAKNPELARAFLDFINRPEVAARNAEFVYYPTPNGGAESHLSAEYLENPLIYPKAAAIAGSEYYRVLPPRTMRRYVSITAEIAGD